MLALACTLLMASTEGYDPSWDGPEVDLTVPLETMSRRQLLEEYKRVEQARPGIGGPIAALSVGGGLMAAGAAGLLAASNGFGGLGAAFTERNPIGFFVAALITVGAASVLTGFWLLWNRRDDRAALGERLDQIDERLETLEEQERRDGRLYRPQPGRDATPAPQL